MRNQHQATAQPTAEFFSASARYFIDPDAATDDLANDFTLLFDTGFDVLLNYAMEADEQTLWAGVHLLKQARAIGDVVMFKRKGSTGASRAKLTTPDSGQEDVDTIEAFAQLEAQFDAILAAASTGKGDVSALALTGKRLAEQAYASVDRAVTSAEADHA